MIRLNSIKTIIICLLTLNALSLLALYSSLHQSGTFTGQTMLNKQIMWIILSWLVLIIFSCINYRYFFNISLLWYIATILLLLAVYFLGKKAMGAQRWISIMGFNFQPSELSKMTTILIVARFFSHFQQEHSLRAFCITLCLVGLNALLIFIQPDLGTALVLIFLFFFIGFKSQIPKKYFITIIIIGCSLAPFAWHHLKDYQKKRLIVFLNPNIDPLGAGYTIIQSKIAIGSGKLLGKGFLSGTQNQFNFLPERHTDFIFTVIAEEWGLVGCLFLLLIFWLILRKILDKSSSITDPFGQLLAMGISAFFFIHLFVNIGMTLGILPVVGLPLTFISYGGSNLLIGFMLMGIFFNISRAQ